MGRFNLSKGERFKIAKSDGLSKIKVVLDFSVEIKIKKHLAIKKMKKKKISLMIILEDSHSSLKKQ